VGFWKKALGVIQRAFLSKEVWLSIFIAESYMWLSRKACKELCCNRNPMSSFRCHLILLWRIQPLGWQWDYNSTSWGKYCSLFAAAAANHGRAQNGQGNLRFTFHMVIEQFACKILIPLLGKWAILHYEYITLPADGRSDYFTVTLIERWQAGWIGNKFLLIGTAARSTKWIVGLRMTLL